MSIAQKILDKETNRIIEEASLIAAGFYKNYSLDLDALCDHLNIKLFEAKYDDNNVSGAITKENGGWTIVVNELHPPRRRRFTVAHELGHYFAIINNSLPAVEYLEDNNNVIKDYFILNRNGSVEDDVYQIERQANMIGAALLMPEDKVRALVAQKLSPNEITSLFGVSEAALSFRLKALGLLDAQTLS